MSRLTPEHISNMSFDEKVGYLMDIDSEENVPSLLGDTIRNVVQDYAEQLYDEVNTNDALRKRVHVLTDDLKKSTQKNMFTETSQCTIFNSVTMLEVKSFVLNTDLKDLDVHNTDKLFELTSKLNLDIMVLSDALELLNNVKTAGNFINKYFRGNLM